MSSNDIDYKKIVEQIEKGDLPKELELIEDESVLFAFAETHDQIKAISQEKRPSQ